MSYKKFQVYFFVTLLVASAVLTLLVFRSYLTMLALGGVIAVIARRPYLYIKKYMKNATASSFLTVLLVAICILFPLAFFLATLSAELVTLVSNSRNLIDANVINDFLVRTLPESLHERIPEMINESISVLRRIIELLSTNLFSFFSNLFGVFLGFIIIMISTYYLLKDGERIKKELLLLSPLGDEHDELVFRKVFIAVEAVVGGTLIMGLIKGVLASVAYALLGLPAPLFWGTMTGFASFLPVVGTSLVTIPMIIYLVVVGKFGAAIILAVIAAGVISMVDNFLQPKLVESRTKIHPLLILLSILGGLQFYGFAGFIIGPLTLAVTMALIDIYKKEFRNYIERAAED